MLRAKHHHFTMLCAAAVLCLAGPAYAQPASPLCETPFETIVTPYPANFGVPTVWDATYSQLDSIIQFAAGVPLESGTVMAWGRKLKPKTFEPVETMLVELNRRGRALNVKVKPAKPGETPVDLILNGKAGYIAGSNIWGGKNNAREQARLSWYDDKGDFRTEKILRDDTFDYTLRRLIPAEGGGFFAIVYAVNNTNNDDQNGIIMRFSREGTMLWRRAYRPGIPNELMGLSRTPDGNYIATGRIRTEDRRMAGWVLKLGPDGTIMWQRTYQRGAFAALSHAATLPQMTAGANDILVLGDAKPLDGDPDAVWIMAMDSTGEPIWQRYVRRSDYALSSIGMLVEVDGRVTLALNAEGLEGGTEPRRDHVRLFTMTGRGVLISDESYVDGIEAEGAVIFRGVNGERGVIGTIQSDARPLTPTEQLAEALKKDETAPENVVPPPKNDEIAQEGWVFLATALDTYDDPCLKKPQHGNDPNE